MGLAALSDGEDCEMASLTASQSEAARFAVDYFCRQVRAAIGAFAAKAGGLDALVFTAGIGEHSSLVREKVCRPLAFLGFELDHHANHDHETLISAQGSKPILRIPADEEAMVRDLTLGACRTDAVASGE
jgi:acetate kinase